MFFLFSYCSNGYLFLNLSPSCFGCIKLLISATDLYSCLIIFILKISARSNLFLTLGRSNAINIAERLGLPVEILENARELYGAASAEINEVFRFLIECAFQDWLLMKMAQNL